MATMRSLREGIGKRITGLFAGGMPVPEPSIRKSFVPPPDRAHSGLRDRLVDSNGVEIIWAFAFGEFRASTPTIAKDVSNRMRSSRCNMIQCRTGR